MQERLVDVLEAMPVADLGPWAAAGMKTNLTDGNAIAQYSKLILAWSNQTQNKSLQTASKSLGDM